MTLKVKYPAALAALQYRDFRLLWSGQLVSQIGTQMQAAALNWHIYKLTGSPVMLGLTGLVRVVPIIVFSLAGGVFADARDRRRVLLITQSLMLFFAALLALATNTDLISIWIIYAIAACTAATVAFDSPARQALAPNLVPTHALTNAMSLNNVMMQVASIAGPGLAGIVIAILGFAGVYWLNAASFLAVLVALVFLRTPTQKNLGAAKVTSGALVEGLRFVFSTKIIMATMLLDFLATFFSSATALLPIYADQVLHIDAVGYGVLVAAESVGAVVAGLAMARAGNVRRQGAILLTSVGAYGVATALYGASTLFALSFFFLALIGASDTVSTILRNTIRQLATPDHIRGRMTSVNMIFFMGGPQLGNLEAGLVAAAFSAPVSVISGGVATVLIVGMVAWLAPQLRNYQAH